MNLLKLKDYHQKPAPFAPGESLFWDDPHVSVQMLKAHLDPASDLAIRAAYVGRPTLAPEAAQALIQATRMPAELTEREREVLALIVEGMSNNKIADRLVVSLSTVKFHVTSILSKLGAASRTEAVSIALQNNLSTSSV